MSTKKVLILAAGRGTRLRPYTDEHNKILLPVAPGATVLDRIVAGFSSESEFVVAVGHKAEQVRGFVAQTYSQRKFSFAEVSDYDGPSSSPGLSAYSARALVHDSFFLVYADTLWNEPLPQAADNWLGVSQMNEAASAHYCNVRVVSGDVAEIKYKIAVNPDTHRTYMGLAHIKDWSLFFSSLKCKSGFSIENALDAVRRTHGLRIHEFKTWQDIGRQELYSKNPHSLNIGCQKI